MEKKRGPVCLFILFVLLSSLGALDSEKWSGENLEVSLVTIGPGDPLYIWWGHIGLLVDNGEQSYFYDFGNFSFEEDNFYGNFLMGRLYYLSLRTGGEAYLRYQSFFTRSVTLSVLNLTPREKSDLLSYLEEGVKPENRTYLYHHYHDNCSTRVRDALDFALDGLIREKSQEYSQSYRYQASRFMGNFWMYFLLNYLQGPNIDKPIDAWELMFVPQELEAFLGRLEKRDGSPLVEETIPYVTSDRLPVPSRPRLWTGTAFLWGMIFFFITMAARLGEKGKAAAFWRFTTVILTALPGLLLGFLMFFTDHDVTWNNVNILVTCPLMLAALPSAVRFTKKEKAPDRFTLFWNLQLLFVLLSFIAEFLPGFTQDNSTVIFIYLPLYLAWGTPGRLLARSLKLKGMSTPWLRK